MNGNLVKELMDFIMSEASLPKKTVLSLESRVYEDLDITGDDAFELIVAYGKKFNVDVSNFMAADYFHGESAFLHASGAKKTLTLEDLLKGIEHLKLDEEVLSK